jgi:orotidine-5'-phosphate decarboxylase
MTCKIYAALDTKDPEVAIDFATKIAGLEDLGVKLGLEFVHSCGHDKVKEIIDLGVDVFLDLKFHDIPNTVAQATKAVASLGASVINLHASGGLKMMSTAYSELHSECGRLSIDPPKLISITVLTSLDNEDLESVGQNGPTDVQALRLASLTKQAGLDGVVCSGRDLSAIRSSIGTDFLTVVPGIRLATESLDDQKRVMTPEKAISLGASSLVIGRTITGSEDPLRTAHRILESISG